MMWFLSRCATRRAVCSLGLLLLFGCARPVRDSRAVYPVDGQLIVNGRPAAGAEVTFHQLNVEGPLCEISAIVESDGHFVPIQGDGAIGLPEGTYALTAVWDEDGRDRFEGQFVDPSSPIATVTIRNEVNLLDPIRLPGLR